MRTIKTTIYKFDELSDKAKERAREYFRTNFDPAWNDESRNSIYTFCARFDVTPEFSIGPFYPLDYSHDATNENFRGLKISQFKRDYMPTGYCLDCDLWMSFYDEFKRTGSSKIAFDHALYMGFKAWRDDLEGQLSDEYIGEMLEANEYEFTEEGDLV